MKRGESGHSCLLAVDKPEGLSSHDVVNVSRRALGEKRVGHCGTLDPFASGVLLVMGGPATRLDKYLTGHDKSYIATIVFGISTTTDDLAGSIANSSKPFPVLLNREFACGILDGFIGRSMQMPPAYSAIKVQGKKACDEARKGNILRLEPRPITIHSADLLEVGTIGLNDEDFFFQAYETLSGKDTIEEAVSERYEGLVFWRVRLKVSKGTYIRSLARDIGVKVGCPAHLGALRRVSSGNVSIDECSSIEDLENDWRSSCIDPVKALGFRVVFADETQSRNAMNGRPIELDPDQLFCTSNRDSFCDCTPPFQRSKEPLTEGELVSIVCDNRLKAIYSASSNYGTLVPECVFNIGVSRGFVA